MERSVIQKFYKDVNVLITGGTGFMGKVLIEKLLRSTEVGTLYLLTRPGKNKCAQERTHEMFDDVLFDRVKNEKPNVQSRVETIAGDLLQQDLGLNRADRKLLISKTHVVIHMAATTRFNEHLKTAFNINVRGTQYVMDLAKHVENLKSFVHVSTAYANYPKAHVNEEVYDPPISHRDLHNVLESMTNHQVTASTPRIIQGWPNTYAFTKFVTESLVKEEAKNLPAAIFRPSTVLSVYKEPIEGWNTALIGMSDLYAGSFLGLTRILYANPEKIIDIIPVDMCISALIASAWEASTPSREIKVYNYCSGPENAVNLRELTDAFLINSNKYPTIRSAWKTCMIFVNNPVYYWFLKLLLHTIPACVFDLFAVLTGNKPKMLMEYKKINKLMWFLIPYSTKTFGFSNVNVQDLWRKMEQRDKELFPFNIAELNWWKYFNNFIRGMRRHLLKDPDDTLDAARKKDKLFSTLHRVGRYCVIITCYNLVTCSVIWINTTGF